MILEFCAGPTNVRLRLNGYSQKTNRLAHRFSNRFPPVKDLDWWSVELTADVMAESHKGTETLELGPVTHDDSLVCSDLAGCPLRHGAPRAVLHGLMGLMATLLRRRGHRLLHAAGQVVPDLGALVVIGPSGAGKSTLSGVLGGVGMGDEAIALQGDEGSWFAQGCLLPGDRLAETWERAPLVAILLPEHSQDLLVQQVRGEEALIALANAVIRLRGDRVVDDFDWAYDLMAKIPVLRVGWPLESKPLEAVKRALDAIC